MKELLRESGHLIRLAVVLALAVGGFLLIRKAVIPEAFGQYGHYRPGAIEDNQKRQPVFAGQAECLMCHQEQADARSKGKHVRVACEACHGPLARHTEDPSANKPAIADVTVLCQRCHEKDAAKPKAFPQVVSKQHAEGMTCNSCHQPHQPKI